MLPEPGSLVGDRYRLEERLASGGMGSVWRARHVELDSEVAVKLMSAEMLDSAHGEKRFRREAQAAARLKSPHIVQVFDYGTFEGQPYLVMELLHGEDLAKRLEAVGPLSPERVVEIVDAVARALGVAHEAGLLHRDLKPANVFVERTGDQEVVKVLDFGIAKQIGGGGQSAGTTGAGVVGSPAYMSPEQVWGEELGPQSDVWALGVVSYELLTGENPFSHEVLAQVFDRIVKAKVPSAREKNPRLPAALDAFFARALARSAADRFRTPRELADALRTSLGMASLASAPELATTEPVRLAARRESEASETLGARITSDLVPERRSVLPWALAIVVALTFAGVLVLRSRTEQPPAASSARLPSAIAAPAPGSPSAPPPPLPEPSASAPAAPRASSAPRVRPPVSPSPAPVPPTTPPPPQPSSHPKWGVPVP